MLLSLSKHCFPLGAHSLCLSTLGPIDASLQQLPWQIANNVNFDALVGASKHLPWHLRDTFVASRLAASEALDGVGACTKQWRWNREKVAAGFQVSIAHEARPLLAAALAWRGSNFRCGVDVVDTDRIAGVISRRPTFVSRWLPNLAKVEGSSVLEVAAAWGQRECCVKILGESHKAFDMGDFQNGETPGFVSVSGKSAERLAHLALRHELRTFSTLIGRRFLVVAVAAEKIH